MPGHLSQVSRQLSRTHGRERPTLLTHLHGGVCHVKEIEFMDRYTAGSVIWLRALSSHASRRRKDGQKIAVQCSMDLLTEELQTVSFISFHGRYQPVHKAIMRAVLVSLVCFTRTQMYRPSVQIGRLGIDVVLYLYISIRLFHTI